MPRLTGVAVCLALVATAACVPAQTTATPRVSRPPTPAATPSPAPTPTPPPTPVPSPSGTPKENLSRDAISDRLPITSLSLTVDGKPVDVGNLAFYSMNFPLIPMVTWGVGVGDDGLVEPGRAALSITHLGASRREIYELETLTPDQFRRTIVIRLVEGADDPADILGWDGQAGTLDTGELTVVDGVIGFKATGTLKGDSERNAGKTRRVEIALVGLPQPVEGEPGSHSWIFGPLRSPAP